MAEPVQAPDETAPEGIDAAAVTAWFEARVDGCTPPLAFDLIAGGHSNLTFSVSDSAGGHWVLRRPPLGQVLASAHDMGREHRIISALSDTDVPVPDTIGLSPDDSVNGAPFYVMDFVDGKVLRSRADAEETNILPFDKDSATRFLDGFNALIIHYLGSASAEARLLGLEPDSPAYLKWVKDTMMFIFLPVLEKAITKHMGRKGEKK